MNDADFTYAIRDDNKEYGFTSLPEAADTARQAAVQNFAGGFQWVAGQTDHQSVAIGFSGSEENLVLLYRVGIDDPFGRRSLRMDAWVADDHQDALDKLTELWNHSEGLPVNLEEFRQQISSNPDASILVGPPDSFVARGFDTIWGLNGPSKPNVAPRSSNPNPSTARKAVPLEVPKRKTRASQRTFKTWALIWTLISVLAGIGYFSKYIVDYNISNTAAIRDDYETKLNSALKTRDRYWAKEYEKLSNRLAILDGHSQELPENSAGGPSRPFSESKQGRSKPPIRNGKIAELAIQLATLKKMNHDLEGRLKILEAQKKDDEQKPLGESEEPREPLSHQ